MNKEDFMSSDDDVVFEGETKRNRFEGIFVGFNALFSEKKENSAKIVEQIPDKILDTLTKKTFCEFFDHSNITKPIIFGPVICDEDSEDFEQKIDLSKETLEYLRSGYGGFVVCIDNNVQDEPFWPPGFQCRVNHQVAVFNDLEATYKHYKFWIDITNGLLLKNGHVNIYIPFGSVIKPKRSFYTAIVLLRYVPELELVNRVLSRKHFSFSEWKSLNADSDTLDGSLQSEQFNVIPLFCPITLDRIDIPVRGANCKHIACFDLRTYIQFQRIKGDWKCPRCSSDCCLSNLQADDFLIFCLKKYPSTVEKLIIRENKYVDPVQ